MQKGLDQPPQRLAQRGPVLTELQIRRIITDRVAAGGLDQLAIPLYPLTPDEGNQVNAERNRLINKAIQKAIAEQPGLEAQGKRVLTPPQIKKVIIARGFHELDRPFYPLDREDIRQIQRRGFRP